MAYYKLKEADLISVLKNLLDKEIVDGVMVPVKAKSGTFTAIVTESGMLDNAAPFLPVFSMNNASQLQHSCSKKIAAVLKPCEARAVNELVKLKQIDKEKIVTIAVDCMGTYLPGQHEGSHELTEAKIKELADKNVLQRNACRVCEFFTPPEAVMSDQSQTDRPRLQLNKPMVLPISLKTA